MFMPSSKLRPGALVRIVLREKKSTPDGFMTIGMHTGLYDHDSGIIYERINLSSFPSCDDFFGETSVVYHGQLATILCYVGRPTQINSSSVHDIYDVYEILVCGKIRQLFYQNICSDDISS